MAWLQSLRTRGVRVLTYVNPFLVSVPGSHGRPPRKFQEALKNDYLIKDSDGEVRFWF